MKQSKVGASMLENRHWFKLDQKIMIVCRFASGRAAEQFEPFDPVLMRYCLQVLEVNHGNSLRNFMVRFPLEERQEIQINIVLCFKRNILITKLEIPIPKYLNFHTL